MSTLPDVRPLRRSMLKTAALFLAAAVLCFIFNAVYGLFAHGVSSAAMATAFLFPLAGALVYALLSLAAPRVLCLHVRPAAKLLFGFGVACFTLRAVLFGVLEIAGASSPHLVWFAVAGGASAAAAVLLAALGGRRREKLSGTQ